MTEKAKRICVIGAGASGLPCIKNCLDEGFEVVCFERSTDIGGLWRFTTQVDGKACCMKNTVINSSKEIQAYSDFPPDKNLANFMHNSSVFEYFKSYAKQFDLTKHIRLNTEVVMVEPLSKSTQTKWRVSFRQRAQDGKSDKGKDGDADTSSEVFDAVMVSTGHHNVPYIPEFEGLKDFKGEVYHSHQLRERLCSERYANKRVVVIGIGNSGLDAANEVSLVASQTYIVTRRGAWILSRYAPGGVPVDYYYNTRFTRGIGALLGFKAANFSLKRQIKAKFDLSLFGILPETEPLADHPHVSDGLLNNLQTGRIEIVRSGIKRFAGPHSIEFTNGERLDDVDVVLMCTGYSIKLPFLPDNVFKVVDNMMPLYRRFIHPDYNTLAMIGYIQPFGPLLPISELQSRVAAALWSGDVSLPSSDEMHREIEEYNEWSRKRFVPSLRHTIEVDFVDYMDDLANMIGVKPNLLKLLVTDFELFRKVVFEGCTPYQFRLFGRNAWPGAREAIMTQRERMDYACAPLVMEQEPQSAGKVKQNPAKLRLLLLVLAAVLLAYLLN